MGNEFEERLRAMARELSESVERAAQDIDVDGISGWLGIDPERAREWIDSAGGWLRDQTEHLGEEQPAPAHWPPADAPRAAGEPNDPRGPAASAGRTADAD